MNINISLFYFFYNLAGKSYIADAIAVAFSTYFFYVLLAAALVVPGIIFFYHLVFCKNHDIRFKIFTIWFQYVLTFLFSWVVVAVLKTIVAFPRPFELFQNLHALLPTGTYDSFPSLHTAFAFALAMTTYGWSKSVGYMLFVVAFCVGISRIYVGTHFPLDVFAGGLIGLLVGYGFREFFVTYVD